MAQKRKSNDINAVPDVPGFPLIGVTRARVRAYTVDMGVSGTSGTDEIETSSELLTLDLGVAAGWAMRLADGAIAILLCAAGPWGCVR